MSSDDRAKLLKRLQKELDHGYHGVELRMIQLVKRASEEVTSVTELGDWVSPFPDRASIASEIDEKISSDSANSREAVNYYMLLFFHGTNTDPKNGPFQIRRENYNYVDPEMADMNLAEGVSPKAQIARNQRHLETYIKLTVGERGENMRVLREENRDLREQLREMQRTYLETVRLQQELMDRSQERAIAARKAAHWEELKANMAKFILPLIPTVLNIMAKHRGIPDGDSPAVATIKGFVMGLSQEDLHMLAGHFGMMRLAPLLELAKGWQADHQRAEASVNDFVNDVTPKAPNPRPPPSAE